MEESLYKARLPFFPVRDNENGHVSKKIVYFPSSHEIIAIFPRHPGPSPRNFPKLPAILLKLPRHIAPHRRETVASAAANFLDVFPRELLDTSGRGITELTSLFAPVTRC